MRAVNIYALALVSLLIGGCGGGDSSSGVSNISTGAPSSVEGLGTPPAPPASNPALSAVVPLRYQIIYYPATTAPAYIVVGPPPTNAVGDLFTIAPTATGVAKVELLPFGFDKMILAGPNLQDKFDPRLMYSFKLPDGFDKQSYVCGTGKFISEVRVTDSLGNVKSTTFEICPGVPFQRDVTAP